MDQASYLGYKWAPIVDRSSAEMPYTERYDPVYGISASAFRYATWERAELAAKYPVALPSGRIDIDDCSVFAPLTMNRNYVNSPAIVTLMATLFQFGVATTDQLIASTCLANVEGYLKRLQAYGLVARVVNADVEGTDIWCFDWSKRVVLDWFSGLDQLSRLLVTGGIDIVASPPGMTSSSAIRHTVLMNELLLRYCEANDRVVGYWGEPFLDGSRFYDVASDEMTRSTAGDGAIVTKTGKIIVFEFVGGAMSSSNAKRTVDKAAAWAAVIGLTELDLSVLFVHGDNDRSNWVRVNQAIYQGTTVELNRFISDPVNASRAADKIGLTSLHRLCPEKNRVSEDLTDLTAWSPRSNRVFDIGADDPSCKWDDERAAVVLNTAAAIHTPPWSRG